jgi:hypothetical protein
VNLEKSWACCHPLPDWGAFRHSFHESGCSWSCSWQFPLSGAVQLKSKQIDLTILQLRMHQMKFVTSDHATAAGSPHHERRVNSYSSNTNHLAATFSSVPTRRLWQGNLVRESSPCKQQLQQSRGRGQVTSQGSGNEPSGTIWRLKAKMWRSAAWSSEPEKVGVDLHACDEDIEWGDLCDGDGHSKCVYWTGLVSKDHRGEDRIRYVILCVIFFVSLSNGSKERCRVQANYSKLINFFTESQPTCGRNIPP